MNWNIDPDTQFAAHNFPVPIQAGLPAAQFPGRDFISYNWEHRIRPQDRFAENVQTSDPQSIINAFQNHEYLQGLALTVSWGSMWRTANSIYGNNALQDIYGALHASAQSVNQTSSVNDAWAILTGHLRWSAVITSKVLHFLCRSLGFQNDPPVAIDNAVILKNVWPIFRNGIPFGLRPRSWRGNSLAAYLRYMTAIIEWASMRNWTTTEIETTLFNEHNAERRAATRAVRPGDDIQQERMDMLITHGGGKAKRFDWVCCGDYVIIDNENRRHEEYSLVEILAVIDWLADRFGSGWFPLANDVGKLGRGEEADGLGVAILRQQPRNITHAQGASYLGVVLEHVGILEWNNRQKGIQWRIIRQPATLDELRPTMTQRRLNNAMQRIANRSSSR